MWHGNTWSSVPRQFNRGEPEQGREMWSPTNGGHRKKHWFWPSSTGCQPVLDNNYSQIQCWLFSEQDVGLDDFLRSPSTTKLGFTEQPQHTFREHRLAPTRQRTGFMQLMKELTGRCILQLHGREPPAPPTLHTRAQQRHQRQHEGSAQLTLSHMRDEQAKLGKEQRGKGQMENWN